MTGLRQMRPARQVSLSWCAVALALLLALPAVTEGADDVLIELAPGESETLSFDADIGTAFVADPGMADVEVLDNRRVFVLGRGHGVTSLKVFGLEGALLGAYAVRVQVQSAYARTIAARLAGKADRIDVESIGDALFVSGTATDPSEAERVLRGIRAVSGETPVVDALALETPAQVNLEVLISEVSRNVTQQLGIDWSLDLNPFENPLRTWVTGTGVRLATGSLGVDDALEQAVEFYPVAPDGTVAEEPQFTNPVRELAVVQPFAARGGDGSVVLSQTKEINSAKYRASAFLEALAENGLAVVHARPNLTAVSGQPAEFFSGLEIPVPTITDRGTIGTEYRQTGVSLTFTPTVLDRDHISLVVHPRIREIAAGGATIAGTIVPNINERSASTTVELGDGESIAIAGLYRRSTTGTEAGVPLLKDIPVWGALFRQGRETDDSVELIIVVTPRIVAPVGIAVVAERRRGPADYARQMENEFYY
ncbi:MAG: hypothetical protein F4X36_04575 [Gammaproteobacteria bacterium]|nr:hypothetical protein [Gammaproteobacteria bacterium]